MIGNLIQPELEALIAERRWNDLRSALMELDVSDIGEILADLPAEDHPAIFRVLPRDTAAQVFSYLPGDLQEALLRSFTSDQMRAVVEEMTPDDQARLLEELPAEVTRRLIETLPAEELKAARDLLGYPPESAGRYMTPEYVALRPEMTAGEAINHIRQTGKGKETLSILYVVDKQGVLLHDLRLASLVIADPAAKVTDLEDNPLVAIPATMDREEVVREFEKYDRPALPVVDGQGHMLGIITVDDVLDVAEEEATEDIHKMGGVQTLDAPYTQSSLITMFRKRGVWLSVLFFGQMLTATVMERFEGPLAQAIVLTLFIPLIISSGGNSGSQATSLAIRALALGEVKISDWGRVLRREAACALMLGLWLGLLGLVRVVLWQAMGWQDYTSHSTLVAITIGVTLIGVVLWGSLVGSMLPFVLSRLGVDPATSSAPFVATLVDVTGLVIYFGVAMAILSGTLL